MYYDSCVGNTLSLYEHKNVTDYSSNNINHNNTHTHTTLTLLCMSSGGAFRSSGLMKRVQLDSNSALLSSPLRLFLRSLLPSFILCSSVDLFQLIRSSSLPWGHMCSAVIPAIAFCFTNLHIFILLAALAAPGATQLWIKEARWPPVTDHYEGNNHQIHKKQQAHIQDRHMVSVLTDAHGGFEV